MNLNEQNKRIIKQAYDLGGYVIVLKIIRDLNMDETEKSELKRLIIESFIDGKRRINEFESVIGL